MSFNFVILAAGKGSRMKSKTPKILQEIASKPVIRWVIDAIKNVEGFQGSKIIAIVSESMKNHKVFDDIISVVQKEPNGSAGALECALNDLNDNFPTIVLCADMPFLQESDWKHIKTCQSQTCVISVKLPNELNNMPYGRIIKDSCGNFKKIVEYKNATDNEKNIEEINTGVYKIQTDLIKKYIKSIDYNSISNEKYLTDIFEIIVKNKGEVTVLTLDDYWSFHGINTMNDLAKAEEIAQDRLRSKFMKNGVKLLDPKSTYFSYDSIIESDVTIEENVIIKQNVTIKSNSTIKAFSYIENSIIEEESKVGPFARLRGNVHLKQNSEVGNFVEIKGSIIGKNSKVKHLSYIGDSSIGQKSNIGAGTITCNYDGFNKHKTSIGNNVFVGSNSVIIAPINIGNDSIIAAGTVVTKDIPDETLAISRIQQENKLGKALEIQHKKQNKEGF